MITLEENKKNTFNGSKRNENVGLIEKRIYIMKMK